MSGASGLRAPYGMLRREIRLAMRRKADVLTPIGFFVLVVSLFPLGAGADQQMLRQIAPGVLWVAVLLATVLALSQLFEHDYQDGALEQLVLSPAPLALFVLAKVAAHWLLTGLPLALLAPLMAVQFGLPGSALPTLLASLLLGAPVLGLIGAIGASLTMGLRNGSVLITLLVLPLYVPVLIFGAGAVEASISGASAAADLSLLGAMLAIALFFAPWATAAALKLALE